MAIAITPVSSGFKFKEVAGNNGAIANSLTLRITDGTFAGDNGDELGTVSGVPAGLDAVLVKTSATTAKLVLKGTATAHNNLANAAANGTTDTTQAVELANTTAGTATVKQVDTVTLSGQYEVGDTITLKNVATADVVYTVKAADIKGSAAATAEAVSVALAAAINSADDPKVDAAATDANGVLTLTAKAASATPIVATATAADRTPDTPQATTRAEDEAGGKAVNTITLSGKYEAGDIITVGGIGGETVYIVVAEDVKEDDADTHAAIATKLIAQINAVTEFTVDATADAAVVTLTTKENAESLDATVTVTNANPDNANGLTVTFAAEDFATGDFPAAGLVVDDIDFKFVDPAEAGTLTLVPPEGADTTGVYSAGSRTNTFENLPTISGTGKTGDKIYIYSNGGTKPLDATKAVTVGENGKWELDLSVLKDKFKDGAHVVTASTSIDGKGAMSAPFAFTVDSKAPSAPSVKAIKGAISDTTPVLSGKAEKFAKVEVFADEAQTKSLGTTFADAKGVWTLAVDNTVLVDNLKTDPTTVYKITAKATDAAGNATSSKKAVDLTIDTKIDTPTLTATPVPKKNTVALTGEVKGETGGTLQLYGGEDGSLALGKAIKIDKKGNWKSSVKLTEGKHLLSVVATDAAGNVSDNSLIKEVTIDTFTATPTLDLVKSGEALTGLKGTAEAGATVKITIGGEKNKYTVTVGDDGTWMQSLSGFKPAKAGKLKITAIATDKATNVSKASTPVEYTFTADGIPVVTPDTTAPAFVSVATSADGKIVLTYDEDLGGTVPTEDLFVVTTGVDGTANAVTNVAVRGKTVTLTLETPIANDVTDIKVAYNAPTAANAATNAAIQDATGNDAAALPATAVTNTVGAPADTTRPTISALSVTDGTTLSVTSNEDGTVGLYKQADDVLLGETAAVTAGEAKSLTVAAQTALTSVSVGVADAAENLTLSTIGVTLGTANADVVENVGTSDEFIFTFDGADTLQFTVATGAKEVVIADFTTGTDKIDLATAAFTELTTAVTGALATADFLSVADAAALAGASVAAATDAQAIVYLQDTGALYYNTNGATAGGLVLIATLVGSPKDLALVDFTVTV